MAKQREPVIADISTAEIDEVVDMIQTVFDHFIAPGFKNEGRKHFRRYIRPVDIFERLAAGSVILTARVNQRLAGVIEIRGGNHIALLFTAIHFQRQGVARRLLAAATNRCLQPDKEPPDILTVNAAPNAVPVYEKLGFSCTSSPQEKYGITFVPMEKVIRQ